MMQDRKALQAGTSHFLGQNFSKAQDIIFQADDGTRQHAWTTSWGVSTRLVGALIMTHGDDDGLVMPPRLAPDQIVILPIYRDDAEREKVMPYVELLQQELLALSWKDAPLRVAVDDRDLRGGEKKWFHVKRGVPIRLEIGPKDIDKGGVFFARRDGGKPRGIGRDELLASITGELDAMQSDLFNAAKAMRDDNTVHLENEQQFRDFFTAEDDDAIHGGFAYAYFADESEIEPLLKELKVTIRCIPTADNDKPGQCFFSGRDVEKIAIFAKAY